MEEQKRREREEAEARERARLQAEEERRKLEQVKELDEDAFSNNTEQREYENLMKGTENTRSVYKIRDSQEEIKHEKDSADFTLPGMPVSSRGTEQDVPALGDDIDQDADLPYDAAEKLELIDDIKNPIRRQ